ncbi:transposase [Bacillus cereus]|uniref:transposase n=1 Tax=Bacillus cereus TaxID=1396 RepID=UPI00211D5234|nr:transposase [Bacillus cereus]
MDGKKHPIICFENSLNLEYICIWPHISLLVVIPHHHAKLLKSFLRENSRRLTLLFLPPYSPNLNMIERVWKVMKENILANCYHETMDHLVDSIYQFIKSIDKNPEAILSRIQRADMSIF